jgi:hypothetical protein
MYGQVDLKSWEAVGQVSVAEHRSTRLVVRCAVRELSPSTSTWQLRAPSGVDLVGTTQYAAALATTLAAESHVALEVVVEAHLFVTRLGDVETLGQVSLDVQVRFAGVSAGLDVDRIARQVARGHARWAEMRDDHFQVQVQAATSSEVKPVVRRSRRRSLRPSLRAVLERATVGLRWA